jgi:hypothetical protein
MKISAAVFTLVLFACAANAQDTADLKLKWPVGSRLVYRMEMKQSTEMQPPGAPQKVKQETNMTQEFAISSLKATDSGGRELELEIMSQKLEVKMNGATMMSLDTKSPESASNPAFAAVTKLVGAKLKYLTNADGGVEKMEDFDEFLAKAAAGSPPQVLEMLRGMLGDKNTSQIASLGNQLPAKPVKIGESWSRQTDLSLGAIGTFAISSKITFSGWEKRGDANCALLETEGTMSSKAGDKPGLMGMKITFDSGKMSGKTWFDVANGRPLETAMHQEFNLKMEMPNPQGANKENIRMTMPMIQDIAMKLVEAGKMK